MCDRDGVRALWRSPMVAGLTAEVREERITFRYARLCKHAAVAACGWTNDVYALEHGTSETPSFMLVSRTTQ